MLPISSNDWKFFNRLEGSDACNTPFFRCPILSYPELGNSRAISLFPGPLPDNQSGTSQAMQSGT